MVKNNNKDLFKMSPAFHFNSVCFRGYLKIQYFETKVTCSCVEMWQLFQRVLKALLHVFFAFALLFERLEQVIRKPLTKVYKPRAYIFVEGF